MHAHRKRAVLLAVALMVIAHAALLAHELDAAQHPAGTPCAVCLLAHGGGHALPPATGISPHAAPGGMPAPHPATAPEGTALPFAAARDPPAAPGLAHQRISDTRNP